MAAKQPDPLYDTPTGLPPCDPCSNVTMNADGCLDMTLDVNPCKNQCSLCVGDVENNMFFQERAAGFKGRCILDEMTYDQVWTILIRNPRAKGDLMRITNDPVLLALAKESKLLVSQHEDDANAAKRIDANSLPFYTFFKGNTNGF